MTDNKSVTSEGVRAAGRPDSSSAPVTMARRTSAELLGARGELIIVHDGREYRLRLTQNGKLILTA